MIKYHSKEWHNLNNLLSLLRSTNAVALVDAYYQRFDNSAPAFLMKDHIEKCEQDLEEGAPYKRGGNKT